MSTLLSQSTSCCSLRLRSFPLARKWAPSIDPVVLKAQHDPHLPCIQIMHKHCVKFCTKYLKQYFLFYRKTWIHLRQLITSSLSSKSYFYFLHFFITLCFSFYLLNFYPHLTLYYFIRWQTWPRIIFSFRKIK